MFLPRPAWTVMVPIYASCITEMTDMRHHPQLVGSDGGLDNFIPGLASNLDPLDLHLPGC
jgi:hypothetical protein